MDKRILDCSESGDLRFHGDFAMLCIHGEEQSIHNWYHQSRRLADGSLAEPGKMFDHVTDPFTGVDLPVEDAADLYRGLWIAYLDANPGLTAYASGFDDVVDSTYSAEALRRRIEAYERNPFDPEAKFAYEHPEGTRGAEVIGAYALGTRNLYVSSLRSSHWHRATEAYKKKPIAEKILEFLEQENTLFWHDQGLANPGSREGCLQLIAKDLAGGLSGWYIEEIRALGNSCPHLRTRARAIVSELESRKVPLSTRIAAAGRKNGAFQKRIPEVSREKFGR